MLRRMTDQERQALEESFLKEARKQFGRMFDPAEQKSLVTFAERESRAMEIGRTLAQRVLEHHVRGDDRTEPAVGGTASCPKCGQPAQLLAGGKEGWPAREVLAEPGSVGFRRPEFRCDRCRRVFFSGGPRAQARHRGL